MDEAVVDEAVMDEAVMDEAVMMERAERVEAGAFWRLLGMRVLEAGEGRAVVGLELRPELLQLYGALHGGVLASLIDGAIGVAVQTTLQGVQATTTTDLHVSYDRPARDGHLRAEATLLKRGRRLAFGRCEVYADDGVLVAHGSATYMILPGESG